MVTTSSLKSIRLAASSLLIKFILFNIHLCQAAPLQGLEDPRDADFRRTLKSAVQFVAAPLLKTYDPQRSRKLRETTAKCRSRPEYAGCMQGIDDDCKFVMSCVLNNNEDTDWVRPHIAEFKRRYAQSQKPKKRLKGDQRRFWTYVMNEMVENYNRFTVVLLKMATAAGANFSAQCLKKEGMPQIAATCVLSEFEKTFSAYADKVGEIHRFFTNLTEYKLPQEIDAYRKTSSAEIDTEKN